MKDEQTSEKHMHSEEKLLKNYVDNCVIIERMIYNSQFPIAEQIIPSFKRCDYKTIYEKHPNFEPIFGPYGVIGLTDSKKIVYHIQYILDHFIKMTGEQATPRYGTDILDFRSERYYIFKALYPLERYFDTSVIIWDNISEQERTHQIINKILK